MNLSESCKDIVVTGGSGFLGSHLLSHSAFVSATVIGRSPLIGHAYFNSVDFFDEERLVSILANKDTVVHLAGRAHKMHDHSSESIQKFRKTNTLVTKNLARCAAFAGVRRFVFISTVKVLGENNTEVRPFNETDEVNPQDPYAVSKVEAEESLKAICESQDMEYVIIRPPLIYGSGVKGNFRTLSKLVKAKFPLPLRSVTNKRSLVAVENLVDLIATCIQHPNAKNQTFLVSDDCDLSINTMIEHLAFGIGRKNPSFRFPIFLIKLILFLIGRRNIYERVCGSMVVDIDFTKKQLGWQPPYEAKSMLQNFLKPTDKETDW